MIHLPRRSVTRFFIPLIDVLLLLFGIFLLMPMVEEEGSRGEDIKVKTTAERLAARVKALEKLEPELSKVRELKDELERLKKLLASPVRDRIYVRIIDIDPKGALLYHDETRSGKDSVFRITDEKLARYLVEKHKKQAGERHLFYVFNVQDYDRFTLGTLLKVNRWFEGVETSLPGEREAGKD
ncbi:MAG: hypothetical protein U0793_29585 [Gemmataceae bacterium]